MIQQTASNGLPSVGQRPDSTLSPLEIFQDRIRTEFVQGSAIAPCLFEAATEFAEEFEYDPVTHEVTDAPIHRRLNWSMDGLRQGGYRISDQVAVFLIQESGGDWQTKLANPLRDRDNPEKQRKYETPKGNGSRAYLPPVPPEIRQRIGERLGCDVPTDGSFWDWVANNPQVPVIITEGGKKSLSLLSAGYVAIALTGVNGGYRKPDGEHDRRYLIPELERFCQMGRWVTLAFDQDSKAETVARVSGALRTFGGLLVSGGCCVQVASWDKAMGKGIDDVIAIHGVRVWEVARINAPVFKVWKAQQLSLLTHTPQVIVNSRYLDSTALLPEILAPGRAILGVKSFKGSGKTELLAHLARWAFCQGIPLIVLTHRVQLGQAICDRLGLPFGARELGQWDGGSGVEGGGTVLGFGLCVDSAHPKSAIRFSADNIPANAIVVMDECEQVLSHLLNSSTEVKKHRPQVLAETEKLLSKVVKGGGKILALDADLSDISINWIRGASGWPGEPFIVLNTAKPEPWVIFHHQDTTPAPMLTELKSAILQGERVFVVTQGQRAKSKWGTQTLEQWFKAIAPDAKILRIDSETIADPEHPAYGCISRLNEVAREYQILVCSPSVETGVSVDLKGHFDSVWGILQGVGSVQSALQFLARLRECVPRHIWVAPRGLGSIAGGGLSKGEILKGLTHSLKFLKTQLTALTVEDLGDTTHPHMEAYLQIAIRQNAQIHDYRGNVVSALQSEGHIVVATGGADDDDDLEDVKHEINTAKKINYDRRCQQVIDAPTLTGNQALTLESKQALTQEERDSLRKHHLIKRYGMHPTQELIQGDDSGLYPKLRLLYFLGLGNEHLLPRDQAVAGEIVESAGELAPWVPDVIPALYTHRVKALELLGIPQLTANPDRIFTGEDADLLALATAAIGCQKHIKAVLGVGVSPGMGAIQILRQLLSPLGLALEYVGRVSRGKNEMGPRRYRLRAISPLALEILQGWLERDNAGAVAVA